MINAARSIGVALYQGGNPLSTTDNVACRYRGEPFSFASAVDLDANTLWVTNASYQSLSEAGLRLKPNVAFDGYFRTNIYQLCLELGLVDDPVEVQCAVLAEMLGAAAEMFRMQIGISHFPVDSLMASVGQMFGFAEAPFRSQISEIAERAIQTYTACERERRHANNSVVFNFWVPRYQWAVRMLNTLVPVNTQLVPVQLAQLPDSGTDALSLVEWAEENQLPLFAQIHVKSLEQVVGRLLNYGAGAQTVRSESRGTQEYDSRNFREWCSLPELKVLAQVGEVEIRQVAVSSGFQRSRLGLHNSRVATVSYSYGLVSENLWVGQTRNVKGLLSKSLSTSWLQAIDRMECLSMAEQLYHEGFEVMTYGYGRIKVVCPISVRALIPSVAKRLGLLYPASIAGVEHLPLDSKSPDSVMQKMISGRDYKSLIRANDIVQSEMIDALKNRAQRDS